MSNSVNPYQAPEPEVAQIKVHWLWEVFHPLHFPFVLGLLFQSWILAGEGKVTVAFVLLVTVAAGCLGHLAYVQLLHYRATVFITVLLIVNSSVAALMWYTSGSLDSDFLFLQTAIPMATQAETEPNRLAFLAIMLSAILLMMFANVIRPSFRTALITAVGCGLWYSLSAMILSHAG